VCFFISTQSYNHKSNSHPFTRQDGSKGFSGKKGTSREQEYSAQVHFFTNKLKFLLLHQLREIESQLSYKQHQIQAICGQNRYLEDKCLFLSNQYEILEKKFQDVQNRLKTFEQFSTKQSLPGRYDPLQGFMGYVEHKIFFSLRTMARCSCFTSTV
jgi:hypothetical protein